MKTTLYSTHGFYGEDALYHDTLEEAKVHAENLCKEHKIEYFVSRHSMEGQMSPALLANGVKPRGQVLFHIDCDGTWWDLEMSNYPEEFVVRSWVYNMLPDPFPFLMRPGKSCGFALFVDSGKRGLREWAGEPLDKVERAECWFEPNQYIFWSKHYGSVELGEWHEHKDPDLTTLAGLAALVPADEDPADVHLALRAHLRD